MLQHSVVLCGNDVVNRFEFCMFLLTLIFHFLKTKVKVQFRGPELYKKKGVLFEEESYLPRIFRSSSLNLHTFHLIHMVF